MLERGRGYIRNWDRTGGGRLRSAEVRHVGGVLATGLLL